MMAVSPAPTQDKRLSAFLENFPTPTPLHYKQPVGLNKPWVFWMEDEEGSDHQIHSSSSAHLHPPMPYQDIIISAFSKLPSCYYSKLIVQLWVPVTIGGKRLLSTSTQPFAIGHLENDDLIKRYRLRCMEYHFNIDVNNNQLPNQQQQQEEDPPFILSGGPASAFLNRLPEAVFLKDRRQGMSPLASYALDCGFKYSLMLPICYPSQTSSCIGLVEFTAFIGPEIIPAISSFKKAVEDAGLTICPVQERIPYKTINGLEPTKDHIEEALKIVCLSHNLLLSQVWINYTDENHVPFSSSLEDSQTKRVIALKLTGYLNKTDIDEDENFVYDYYDICDLVCLKAGEGIVEQTLEDYKPRFCINLSTSDLPLMPSIYDKDDRNCWAAICLRSVDTGDLDYAFEFIWHNSTSNYVILLEALLLTLKRCLPSFKFASGAELGDQLELHLVSHHSDSNDSSENDAENITESETESFMIFQGKKSSPLPIALEAGKKPIVVDCKAKWKTAPKELPREVIEKQFGNTMKKAAQNLKVSLSTLKRKCKDYHIDEWQGPNFLKKGKVNNASRNNHSNRNEEDTGAVQEPSVVNKKENTLTIKAEYADDTIKFDLHFSEATFVNAEKKIGVKFNLTLGSYKLNYRDEDGDWILLGSDEDMKYCIKRLRNLGQTVVRLRVLPSPQQPSSYALSNLFVP